MEQRSQEWYELALERGRSRTIEPRDAGRELLDLAREDSAVAVLKLWEAKGLLDVVYPALKRRKPDYEKIKRLVKVRDTFAAAGLKVRLAVPTLYYIFRRLKARGMATALYTLDFPSGQATRIMALPVEAKKLLGVLRGSKTKVARNAYEVISSAPTELLAFVDVEFRDAKVTGKIRNYLTKWRPLHQRLPAAELESLGISRGTKFDKILGELFELQLRGRGKTPEDVTKLLKRLAGIKEEPKKRPKDEKGPRPRTAQFIHKKRLGKAAAGASSLGKEPPSRLPQEREESAGTVVGGESPKTAAPSSSKKTIKKRSSGHGNLTKRAARRRGTQKR